MWNELPFYIFGPAFVKSRSVVVLSTFTIRHCYFHLFKQGSTKTMTELWFSRLLAMIWKFACGWYRFVTWLLKNTGVILRADNWFNCVKIDTNNHFLVCEIFSKFVSACTNSGLPHGMTRRAQQPKKKQQKYYKNHPESHRPSQTT